MGEKPRTCGQCRHLEPSAIPGFMACYAADGQTIYPAAKSDRAHLCPKFEAKPAEAPPCPR